METASPKYSPRWYAMGFSRFPVVLAPLAGVSDHPFRRACAAQGAELTYVEMLSATALLYQSRRTLEMARRHPAETKLGVQITGKTADEVARAVEILDRLPFDTIDINMGCPVNKVVRAGCGSGFLKDPERIRETVRLTRGATAKPLSVKIRLGWDTSLINFREVVDIIQSEGADWLTVHGRLRSDDYGDPVDLPSIRAVKERATIPILGNGNIFSAHDAEFMKMHTGVDGVMISRGALGNPWVFREFAGNITPCSIEEWYRTVCQHLSDQSAEYGNQGNGAVCMRKHLLWYARGWPGAKKLREEINSLINLEDARRYLSEFVEKAVAEGHVWRSGVAPAPPQVVQDGSRFSINGRFGLQNTQLLSGHVVEAAIPAQPASASSTWDPKYDMDRRLDRGVGDDHLGSEDTNFL